MNKILTLFTQYGLHFLIAVSFLYCFVHIAFKKKEDPNFENRSYVSPWAEDEDNSSDWVVLIPIGVVVWLIVSVCFVHSQH